MMFLVQPMKEYVATIFNRFIRGGNKRAYTLKQTHSWKLQICVSVHGVLVSSGMNMD